MLDKMNDALIKAIHTQMARCSNPASLLMDTLHIGREAAYRRLRGEVLFTFEEAAVLGKKLHFSLDKIMDMSASEFIMFRLGLDAYCSPVENYEQWLKRDLDFLRDTTGDSLLFYALAGNTIPAEIFFEFKLLSKFKLYKWLYQNELCGDVHLFEELPFPVSLQKKMDEYIAVSQRIPTTNYVFDSSIFMDWINTIRAFRAMHLISGESVEMLRHELSLMIDDLRDITSAGAYSNGNKVHIYLSDLNICQTSSYVSNETIKAAGFGVFTLNALRTTNTEMSEYVFRWIQMQSRFATLVSRSGELRRINYIKRQRENLSLLD